MSDKFIMSIRQAAELDHALERNGLTPADVKLLSSGNVLTGVRNVLRGYAEIKLAEHVIDCDAEPILLNSHNSVHEHRKSGFLKWDKAKQEKPEALYRAKGQTRRHSVEYQSLKTELSAMPVLNINVLDYLLSHPELIPESWKEKYDGAINFICFWGTIVENHGYLYVPSLYWDEKKSKAVSTYHWTGTNWWENGAFHDNYPAALFVS